MSRGRKRKFNSTIPGHIEQEALPRGIYWERDRWFTYAPHPEGGRDVKVTVASATARLSELHAIMEKHTTGTTVGTLEHLFHTFHKSLEFKELELLTQKHYKGYASALEQYALKDGSLLGQLPVERVTTPLVQRLVETYAMGRPATRRQPAVPATPSKANHLFRYLRRTLAWGVRHGICKSNAALGVRQAKEAKAFKMPTAEAYRRVLAFARDRGALTPHTKGSFPSYLAPVMVLAYSVRLRGIEVCTLTDAHRLDEGIHSNRRKGSRDNVTRWDEQTTDAWSALVDRRKTIWNRPGRGFAIPLQASARFLLVEQTGNPMRKSSLDTVWQRFIREAIRVNVISEAERFSLHGLKHRGITDTAGNRGDKQDAAGHVTPEMTDRYDHELPVVDTPKPR